MKKAMDFTQLDLLTVKPYLTIKNISIFLITAAMIIVFSQQPVFAIGIMMAFAAICITYPFSVGERCNIDILYLILSIKKNTIVLGRYLYVLFIDIIVALSTFFFIMLMMFLIMGVGFTSLMIIEIAATVFILFIMFTIIQAIQLPIYFKLGFTKAQFLTFLAISLVPLTAFLIITALVGAVSLENMVVIGEWLRSNFTFNVFLIIFGLNAFWFALVFASYKLSIKFYKKREF